jgi:hypothetical protein
LPSAKLVLFFVTFIFILLSLLALTFCRLRLRRYLSTSAYLVEPSAIRGGGLSTGAGSGEIESSSRGWCACSVCAGASFCPQSGQLSKSTDVLPTSRVIAFRSTVTSVRTVRLVP